MAHYIDGFVVPVPKKGVDKYMKISKKAGRIWKKHGALAYYEAAGDDLIIPGMKTNFPKLAKTKSNETVVFAFIIFKNKKHRDTVNKKVMADPWMNTMNPDSMPFDHQRMAYGGFKAKVKY